MGGVSRVCSSADDLMRRSAALEAIPRWHPLGPRHLKIGGRVLYRVADIEDYEVKQERSRTLGAARKSDPTVR